MNALVFLGIAAVIAVIGGLAVAVFHDRSEVPSDDGVGQFKRIMDALAPDDTEVAAPVRSARAEGSSTDPEAEG